MPALTEATYENKVKIFAELAQKYPDKAMHKKSQIVPPTWTVDRLNSLISGGYPSQDLIDQVYSFKGHDHVLDGLKGSNYFFGDVVWRSFLEADPDIHIQAEYFNFFTMTQDHHTEDHLFDRTIAVASAH